MEAELAERDQATRTYSHVGPSPTLDRIRRYLHTIEPAISGQHGHDKTFYVACKLVMGFGLTPDEARPLMVEYSQRCAPPWSDKEIDHKLQDANKQGGPRGYLAEGKKPKATPSLNGTNAIDSLYGDPVPISWLQKSEQPKWIWHRYLSRGGITLLTALWKSGKTTLVGHLLKAMEAEGEFCGLPVDRTKVIYVTEESENRWVERRDRIGIADHVEMFIRPFKAKTTMEEWLRFIEHLGELHRKRPFDLVVFDPLVSLWPVKDENDASAVNGALLPLHTLAEKQVGLLLVHHNRKGDGTEATATRGSGALPAFVDTIIELRRYDNENFNDRRRVLQSYGRDDESTAEMVVELNEGGYVAQGEKRDVKASDLIDNVLGILPAQEPGLTISEICSMLNDTVRRQTMLDCLRCGFERGAFERSGIGSKTDPYRFWLNRGGE